jgi:CRP-like cAMP-binding protein
MDGRFELGAMPQDGGTDGPCMRRTPVRQLESGQWLYFEDDDATYCYEVLEGVFRLSKTTVGGQRKVVGFAFAGETVGYSAGNHHSCDCHAVTEGSVRPYALRALAEPWIDPEVHGRLVRGALREIDTRLDGIIMTANRSAQAKLSAFLLDIARRQSQPLTAGSGVLLPMGRADIADFLGITTETVSRTFTQLRKRGIIRLEGAHCAILLRPCELMQAAGES